ncbi:hypothetical protein CL689_02745 [Candidatus Saccharibacteria bacterium]|nr:hypothetical protein [Candidatus Saccharibacteria bacterium]|tara:strand:+ start:132 stop:1121 length:990 start_codon:yes stop_codon:yes gene_type:complete
MTSTPKKDYVALGKKAAEMAEFVKAKTGRKLPLSAARELLAMAHDSASWNHLHAASANDSKVMLAESIFRGRVNGIETRLLGMLNSDHVSEEVADGSVFKGTVSEWRLYSNETTSATYYLGDDAELFESDCKDLLNKHDLQVFRVLMSKGFIEVRFDEDAEISDDLPMRPGLLDTENFKSSSLQTRKSSLSKEKESASTCDPENEVMLYACHCDLNTGENPDACVIDLGRISDCSLALANREKINWKNQCPHWKPSKVQVKEAARAGLYACKCDPVLGGGPDSCAIDTGEVNSCKKAVGILNKGKEQNTCEHWVPVSVFLPSRVENPPA